jgi:hypothetical protein
MKNHREPDEAPDEIEDLCSVDSYREMEYRLQSLRSLVCDLLKTNQELRDALLDARIDTQYSAEPPLRNTPR